MSATNLQSTNLVSTNGIFTDLSGTRIWSRDLSATNLDVSGNIRIQSSNIRYGIQAGNINQGLNAIAIGSLAGRTNQSANSIIINATGTDLVGSSSGLYIAPIRNIVGMTQALYYNTTTSEIVYADISGGGGGGTNFWTLSSSGNDIFNNTNSNNGNVGIGTGLITSVPYKLDVSGSARMRNIIDTLNSDGSNNSVLIGTTNGIRWTRDLSLNNLVSTNGIFTDLSGTRIWSRDLSATNIQASRGIFTDLSGTRIWSRDLSASNLASINGIFTDLSGTRIWSRDLSASNLASTNGIFTDLSGTRIWSRDLSATNLQSTNLASTNGIFTDLSGTRIWTRDLSSTNIQSITILANTIDASINILQNNDNSIIYPLFARNAGNQRILIDTSAGIVFNPFTNFIGIGLIDPSYNVDISGETRIQTDNVRFGRRAGNTFQGSYAIAIGFEAGLSGERSGAISIGYQAGQTNQGTNSIAIGIQAGISNEQSGAIAIGFQAGQYDQSSNSIAIGVLSGNLQQRGNSIAIGSSAGRNTQGSGSVAIGFVAGQFAQGSSGIAIGNSAGMDTQGTNAIAIGVSAGHTNQGQVGIGIGVQAGGFNQSSGAIAIGFTAGRGLQGNNSIAIGVEAGLSGEQSGAIAIGFQSGNSNQGRNSIAIGSLAGRINQTANSIIINATGVDLSSMDVSGLFIAPIRRVNGITQSLFYNTSTSEIVYADGGSSQWTNSGSDIYNSNAGNVGIGTNGPAAYRLDISGNARVSNRSYVGNSIHIGNTSNILLFQDTSTNIDTLVTSSISSVIDIFHTAFPYGDTSNVIIDISYANWGSNNVSTILDIMTGSRSLNTSLGAGIVSGRLYAMNTSAGATFNNFNEIGLTTKDISFTYVSPGNYGLRLSFRPTNRADIVTGAIRVVNITGTTPIQAIYSRLFNSSGVSTNPGGPT